MRATSSFIAIVGLVVLASACGDDGFIRACAGDEQCDDGESCIAGACGANEPIDSAATLDPCLVATDAFDDATAGAAFAPFGDPLPSVVDGTLAFDLPAAGADAIGLDLATPHDLRDGSVSALVVDELDNGAVQQYLDVAGAGGVHVLLLATVGLVTARVANTDGFVDVSAAAPQAPFELRVDLTPRVNGAHVVWFAGGAVFDERDVDGDFSASGAGFIVQSFLAPASDPPPYRFDDVAIRDCH